MAHFAKVRNNVVEDVIVAEQTFIDNELPAEEGVSWIQTSYNTIHGKHYAPAEIDENGKGKDRVEDDKPPLRGNYATIGGVYDSTLDAFYQTQPFASWTLNTTTFKWEPPTAEPTEGDWDWDEETKSWVEADIESC